MKNIVFLYSEVMNYTLAVMRAIRDHYDCKIVCVYWDKVKKHPYIPNNEQQIEFIPRSSFQQKDLLKLLCELNPKAIYVSGRMDKGYLYCCKKFHGKITIISGFDNQWSGSLKNYIACALSSFLYKRYFDFLWVPGVRQYEYARRLGFNKSKIIPYLYCADLQMFHRAYKESTHIKNGAYPHSFVFVGRFDSVKGTDLLIKAFRSAKIENNNDWILYLVGSNKQLLGTDSNDDIIVLDFVPNHLIGSYLGQWGVFCLPSRKEPWGVVIHEFAAAGLPIICSDAVGAADTFLINEYNGFTFSTGAAESLKSAIINITNKSDEELLLMGRRSNQLSYSVTPEKSAYAFLSKIGAKCC